MKKEVLGKTKAGEDITGYTLEHGGLKIKAIDLGCNLYELWVPDKDGNMVDVSLGFADVSRYEEHNPGFGGCIAPVGNRIENARFTLAGKTYELEKNCGEHNIHSGTYPMHQKMYKVTEVTDNKITMTRRKEHMELGMPGNMDVTLSYTLLEDCAVQIDYYATTDEPAIFAPTNHTYFNLSGHNAGSIADHVVQLNCSTFTMADDKAVPHGEIAPVKGTPMDFTTAHKVGDMIDDTSYDPIKWARGYDHNYVIDEPSLDKPFGYLYDEKSGRKMLMYTNFPGVQLYTANGLSAEGGKDNTDYERRMGICFEAQFYPNSINVESFPQPVVLPGEGVHYTTIYRFVNE